mmetsp:Transcript_37022/g.94655  ORF Transcript_37022/g.94655 Transcript_37022/m.94655 type:complete len:200 (-) Transcript_37022:302-901(-)
MPPPKAPKSASKPMVLASKDNSGKFTMKSLTPSKMAIWIAPAGTSRQQDALHARNMFCRPSGEPSTRCAEANAEASLPDCKLDLIASAGARITEPHSSPAAPAKRYTTIGKAPTGVLSSCVLAVSYTPRYSAELGPSLAKFPARPLYRSGRSASDSAAAGAAPPSSLEPPLPAATRRVFRVSTGCMIEVAAREAPKAAM